MNTVLDTSESDLLSARYTATLHWAPPSGVTAVAGVGMSVLLALAPWAALQTSANLYAPSSSWVADPFNPALTLIPSTPFAAAAEAGEDGAPSATVASTAPTTAELLTYLHADSGLTWDQLARYFGVSRRAVHLWVAGGHMSAANEEALTALTRAVDNVRSLDPAARRQALLSSDAGLNIIDAARAERSSRSTDINRSPDIHEVTDKS